MTVELEYFGFFEELGLKVGELDSRLRESIGATPSNDMDGILQYLAEGWVCIETFDEMEVDILTAEHAEIGAMRILTDGLWVWPNVTAHYVKHHGLTVPSRFVERMRAHAWHVPAIPDAAFDDIVDELVGTAADDGGLEQVLKLIEEDGGKS